MSQNPAPESPFLDTEAAATYLHLKKATLERWRSAGGGPVFYKLGGRCFYRAEDLDAFARSRRRRSTSDPGDHTPPEISGTTADSLREEGAAKTSARLRSRRRWTASQSRRPEDKR